MNSQKRKIDGVVEWVRKEAPGSFKPNFVYGVCESYRQNGRITPSQEDSLDRIIVSFKIGDVYFK